MVAGFALFWFSYTLADPDLWGHVRFGQDIVRTGRIVQADEYSYRTAGQRWINHHGGVLAGVGVLGLWVIGRAIDQLSGFARSCHWGFTAGLGPLVIACGLGLLVNPYGPYLLEFLWRTATVPRPEISEWAPLA